MRTAEYEITKCFRIYGIVQGVGFRPTVSRHAASCGIRGTVSNMGPYVEILAQGRPQEVSAFRRKIEEEAPVRSFILNIQEMQLRDAPHFTQFDIVESAKQKGAIYISPDIAVCDTCKKELYDPGNRRYLHPFINCTCCGPRLTILDALPYDRERTSMKEFPMCPECASEYTDPESRRYDAQPVCCHDCGPQVYLIGRKERGREAITYTRRVIREGGIAAVKGIGGFHLCCDASNEKAVQLLRARKRRPMKPLAVMARDLAAARKACEISEAQEKILDGHQKPILLLKRRPGAGISDACTPDNPKIGMMLPYAPVQLLLFDYDDGLTMPDYLVMTSANDSGAPICRDDADAISELGPLSDVMLSHDRRIRIRADDTVMDFYRGTPYMVRRSRGYAPLPIALPLSEMFGDSARTEPGEDPDRGGMAAAGDVLAIGGELKNTFCVGTGDLFYLSPYVGDLEDVRTQEALRETVDRFETLLEVHPEVTACDMHPLYHSAEAAREMGRTLHKVQHHYAHVLSCMAENGFLSPVIGISYDGTGYGTDGTIWGGEILLSDLSGFQRAAHIRPFLQIGADAGVREGWRIAAGMICQMYPHDEAADIIRRLCLCTRQEAQAAGAMIRTGVNAAVSTSAGRLFDAVSALLGIRRASTFEGEAATALQFRAMEYETEEKTDLHPAFSEIVLTWDPAQTDESGSIVLPTDALLREIIRQRLSGADIRFLAWQFHRTLSALTVRAAVRIREKTKVNTALLTGGVFQNTLLLGMCEDALTEQGFEVLRHHLVPPNDGGIALGQAVSAAARMQRLVRS